MSIQDRTQSDFILTIIDDCSSKDDVGYQWIRGFAKSKPINVNFVFNKKNVGVTPNLNYGFQMYPDLDCVRLDADIEIQSNGWLGKLKAFAKSDKKIGVVAPLVVDPDFVTINSMGQRLVISPEDSEFIGKFNFEVFDRMGTPRFDLEPKPIEVDSVLGCCAYYKREVIDLLGGVDEEYFGWVEDNDFCIGARFNGYGIFILPDISFCHHEHASKRGYEERKKILEKSEARFIEKWGFSLYDPVPYWDDIVKLHSDNQIMWRYKNDSKV